jgi:hypothetical protein
MSTRVLVAYSMASAGVQTTFDYLRSFKMMDMDVEYMHVTHGAICEADPDRYDVLINNYCARLNAPDYVSASYRRFLQAFQGLKVLSVQDEYERTDTLKAAIKAFAFDIVLTCVPEAQVEQVYPRAEFPGVRFATVITGYVPEALAELQRDPLPLALRPIVLGYRGRDLGGRFGRLAFEKFEIGRRMKELCELRGIPHDIAMDEGSRIYGPAWLDFVGSCRAMLGSESGSNVFDFDGSIERQYGRMAEAKGSPPTYQEFLPIVGSREGFIDMGQISPRVFECAVMRTPMILFRGRYSDAIQPDEHYIPLEKDFSNADQVFERLGDLDELRAMADRAFSHLVESGRFSYGTFATLVEGLIESGLASRSPRVGAFDCRPPDALNRRDRVLRSAPTSLPERRASFELQQQQLLCIAYEEEAEALVQSTCADIARYQGALDQIELRLVEDDTAKLLDPGLLDRLRAFRGRLGMVCLVQPQAALEHEKQNEIAAAADRARSWAKTLHALASELGAEYAEIAESVSRLLEVRSRQRLLAVARKEVAAYQAEVRRLKQDTIESISAYLSGLDELQHRLEAEADSSEAVEPTHLERLSALRERLRQVAPAATREEQTDPETASGEELARAAKALRDWAGTLSTNLNELGAEYGEIAQSISTVLEARLQRRQLAAARKEVRAYQAEVRQLTEDTSASVAAYLTGLVELQYRLETDSSEAIEPALLERLSALGERLAQALPGAQAPEEQADPDTGSGEELARAARALRDRARALSANMHELGAEYGDLAQRVSVLLEARSQQRQLAAARSEVRAYQAEVRQLEGDTSTSVAAYLSGLNELQHRLEAQAGSSGAAGLALSERLGALRERLGQVVPGAPGPEEQADPETGSGEELARAANALRDRARALSRNLNELGAEYGDIAQSASMLLEAGSQRRLLAAYRAEAEQAMKNLREEITAYLGGLDDLEGQIRSRGSLDTRAGLLVQSIRRLRDKVSQERLAERSLVDDHLAEEANVLELAGAAERSRRVIESIYKTRTEMAGEYMALVEETVSTRQAASPESKPRASRNPFR